MGDPRISEFLRCLRASQLLDRDQLEATVVRARDAGLDADDLARELVAKGVLTRFQAGRLLGGHSSFAIGPIR